MKVADLIDAELDKWVANAHGMMLYHEDWQPSRNWSQGGPLIEQEGISVILHDGVWVACAARTLNRNRGSAIVYLEGKTPLEAAMRCYVASKFGEEVQE